MDFFRGLVSGKKIRYDQNGFNLDLTYITNRIIAMCFPGSGVESLYRNNIDDVANFLERKHNSHYMIFNLGGRPYDYAKFKNRVKEFDWEDHHSPSLDLLFKACQLIDEFLQKHPENVIVVHCNAGKGRTGTLISCYLRYSGRFDKTHEAMQYYKRKRFESGGGVTQPSQVRYVEYFATVLGSYLTKEPSFHPVVVQIDQIVMYGMPKSSFVGYIKPFVELYDVRERKLRHTTKRVDEQPPKFLRQFLGEEVIPIDLSKTVMSGDILVRVHDFGSLINLTPVIIIFPRIVKLPLHELDPDSLKKDDHYPNTFRVELYMTVLSATTEPEDPNSGTVKSLFERDKRDWDETYNILGNYKQPSKEEAQGRLFTSPERDEVDEMFKAPINPFTQLAQQNQSRTESI